MNRYLPLLLLFPPLLSAAGVQWRSWTAATAEAERTGKPIMVDAVRDHCRYCLFMDSEVFEDAEAAAAIEKRFIPLKINLSHESMPLDLEVPMTPSFYFLTADRKLIKRVPGAWEREDFLKLLKGVLP